MKKHTELEKKNKPRKKNLNKRRKMDKKKPKKQRKQIFKSYYDNFKKTHTHKCF